MRKRYLIDTNVIYPYTLRDIFITLGASGVKIHWSPWIEAEFIRARRRKSGKEADKAKHVVALMRRAVPDWRAVASKTQIASLTLPNPDDRPVFAAAIQIGADVIVTDNHRDFPESALAPYGIVRMSPDQALCELHDGDPGDMIEAVAEMRARMVNPPHAPEQWLERAQAAGARSLAERLRPFADRL